MSDQYPDLVKPVEGVPHHPADISGYGQIGRYSQDMALGANARQFNFGATQGRFVTSADSNTGPFPSESQGNGPADASAGASHNGDPVS
jgi:hypothetical protein